MPQPHTWPAAFPGLGVPSRPVPAAVGPVEPVRHVPRDPTVELQYTPFLSVDILHVHTVLCR